MMDLRYRENVIAFEPASEFPLSLGQRAIWFHQQLAPQSVAYHLAGGVFVPGNTDLRALQIAFNRLAERHPMLRAYFSERDGVPAQSVLSSIEVPFHVIDASGWDQARLDERLEREIYRPFDLERGLTWRVTVFQGAPDRANSVEDGQTRGHLVLLTLHHIIADLWSTAILMQEVAALYQEAVTGIPARLKALKGSYEGFVAGEAERLRSPLGEQAWDYWRKALSGELPRLNLPADHPHSPKKYGRGAEQAVRLGTGVSAGLHALAEKHHVPIYVVLLAAFQTLLYRFTGQDDVLVGFPKSGRSPATARLVGYFVNQSIVRSHFTPGLRFLDLLAQVQAMLVANRPHDWYPFSTLVQRLQPTREVGSNPLIQAVFSWQQAPRLIPRESAAGFVLGRSGSKAGIGGLPLRSVHLPYRAAPFELTLLATEAPQGLQASIEYAADLFDAESMQRFAGCYATLLDSIIESPDQPISKLNILPEAHRDQLVHQWNDTAVAFPEVCLHQLYEKQSEHTPGLTAAEDGRSRLTYRQLNERANQLAHYLQGQGVHPGQRVGVLLRPSVDMIVAILGVLKAGGAYLPLDPSFPQERLTFMLDDANPAWVITSDRLRASLPDFKGPVCSLDGDANLLKRQSHSNPANQVSPDDLAYVIYTSGSTGHPKGALLTHRGVVNLLTDFQRRRPIRPGDACSWWTSPSFDVSVYEIFSPLLAGGTLQVIPEDIRLTPVALFGWLKRQSIRSAYLPPFFLREFFQWVKNHPGESPLQRLLVGVEPISNELLIDLIERIPDLVIINGYGPTETTICSTLYPVRADDPHSSNTPIGRPAANTQIYLLDDANQPVPIGAVGEVFIGGVGLARGYLKRPDQTARRFIPSPFHPGERLYRTGDLARYLPDGNLVFVGRRDSQVKIHGMRIEPGEIEAILSQHPQIDRVAVLTDEQPAGEKRLVACFTSPGDWAPSPADLRKFLGRKLPNAMIPSVFRRMDHFPLTATGKLDRAALQDRTVLPGREETHRLPRTRSERTLAKIWQLVLGLDSVSVTDNFFALGGDSILSLQIIAKAREAGLQLSPKDIFQAPTIAGLAVLANEADASKELDTQTDPDRPFPLTPVQQWFFDQHFPNSQHWNQYVLLDAARPLDTRHLRDALAALLNHHDALRLRFRFGAAGWQQTYAPMSQDIPLETIDLSGMDSDRRDSEVERVIVKQQHSLDLSAGPLIRAVYFRLGEGDPGKLLVVIHHLAVDGVSWRILIEDLQTAYQQLEHGQAIHLPQKTSSFQAWSLHLNELAQAPSIMPGAKYWNQAASSQVSALPLDTDIDRPSSLLNTAGDAQSVSIVLGTIETQRLIRQVSGRHSSKLQSILLAALARAFQRWSGSLILWLDLEGHGREPISEELDLSRTVGWFTSIYPLRLVLPPQADLSQTIEAVDQQLSQVPDHGLDYGLLRYLHPEVNNPGLLQNPPDPQVSFNYLGKFPESPAGNLFAALTPDAFGFHCDPKARRAHLLEIEAAIFQGELHVIWRYAPQIHTKQTVERMAGFFLDELHGLSGSLRSHPMRAIKPGRRDDRADLEAVEAAVRKQKGAFQHQDLPDAYPLSPLQEGMVLSSLLSPDAGLYFEQTVFTIQSAGSAGNSSRSEIDLAALKGAWQAVIDRHPTLRTAFIWQGVDEMRQVVYKKALLPLKILDWRRLSEKERSARLEELLQSERAQGFNLAIPPLLRLELIREPAGRIRILLNHHHAILDGWSIALLLQEVFERYAARTNCETFAAPPARPYHEYVNWLQVQDLGAAEVFWRKELEGLPPSLRSSGLRAPSKAAQQAERVYTIPGDLTSALQVFTRRNQLTLNTLFQGAWAQVLSRLNQRDDVVFGVTLANRPAELSDALSRIGLMINTLPLRVRFPADQPVLDWLRRIQQNNLDLQRYAYTPLAQIQTWTGASHSTALFDTLFVFENYPVPPGAQTIGGFQLGKVRSIEQTQYPLAVAILPGDGLRVKILYDADRFSPETIQELLDHLVQALGDMIANPSLPLPGVRKIDDISSPHRMPYRQYESPDAGRRHVAGPHEWVGHGPHKDISLQAHRLEEYLARLWEKLLQVNSVSPGDDFFDLGGDSLKAAICVFQIQSALEETVPLTAIFDCPTVSQLAGRLIQEHPAGVARLLGIPAPVASPRQDAVRTAAVVPIHPLGTKTPLFCIHPAGGVVFPYYALAPYLGKDQPLYGVQDPALYDERAAVNDIETMAASYIDEIRKVQPVGPYRLLGWSAGGLIAFEMAQQLTRQGQVVSHLFLLDTQAPAEHAAGHRSLGAWMKALPGRMMAAWRAVDPIVRYVRSGLFLKAVAVFPHRAPGNGSPTFAERWDWIRFESWRSRLLKKAGVADVISEEANLLLVEMPAVQRILKLVRAHIRRAQDYNAQPYPGHVTLFRARNGQPGPNDSALGWERLTGGGVEVHWLRSNHVALLVKPYVEMLANELLACLQAQK